MTLNERNILLQELEKVNAKGTLNGRNADRRENLHRLFMYPAMMVPETQSAIINIFAQTLNINNAIDPFMGSGTSLLSCIEFGLKVYGQDINPFAVLLSKAKTIEDSIEDLNSSFKLIKERINKDLSESIDIDFYNIDKWFTKDAQISFSKIRRSIQKEEKKSIRIFFWVLMSETIRMCSNDRTSTFKLHCRSLEDIENRNINVLKEFFSISERGIDDLKLFRNKLIKEHYKDSFKFSDLVDVTWGNTQESINTDKKYDLLVSSPPYGDNLTTVTYGQNSYLPLQWIDPIDIDCPYEYLRSTQEIDKQSLGGKINQAEVYRKREKLFNKTKHLKSFYSRIPDDEQSFYNKTISFIADFDESLDNIINVMDDNAFYIWTIGNRFVKCREVPNAEVLQDLMEYRGFSLFFKAERQILNKKQPRKNNFSKTMEKEVILIFSKENI